MAQLSGEDRGLFVTGPVSRLRDPGGERSLAISDLLARLLDACGIVVGPTPTSTGEPPSGIKPSSDRKSRTGSIAGHDSCVLGHPAHREVQLGNLLGAIRNWVADQHEADSVFCVVDLHALTIPQDPAELRDRTLEMAQMLVAVGHRSRRVHAVRAEPRARAHRARVAARVHRWRSASCGA